MILITSPAGVRMAKAHHALAEASNDTELEPWQKCSKVLAAMREYDDAVEAVAQELRAQRLHEMTGP